MKRCPPRFPDSRELEEAALGLRQGASHRHHPHHSVTLATGHGARNDAAVILAIRELGPHSFSTTSDTMGEAGAAARYY